MHKASILRKVCEQLSFFPPPKGKSEFGNRLWEACPVFILLFLTPVHTPRREARGSLTLRQTLLRKTLQYNRVRRWASPSERFLTLSTSIPSLSPGADQLITSRFPPPQWPRVIKEKTGNRRPGTRLRALDYYYYHHNL